LQAALTRQADQHDVALLQRRSQIEGVFGLAQNPAHERVLGEALHAVGGGLHAGLELFQAIAVDLAEFRRHLRVQLLGQRLAHLRLLVFEHFVGFGQGVAVGVEGVQHVGRPRGEAGRLVHARIAPHVGHRLHHLGHHHGGIDAFPAAHRVVAHHPVGAPQVDGQDGLVFADRRIRRQPLHDAVVEAAVGIKQKQPALAFAVAHDVLLNEPLEKLALARTGCPAHIEVPRASVGFEPKPTAAARDLAEVEGVVYP